MRKIIIIVFSLMLSGCWYQVDSWELSNMQKNCESNGGLNSVNTFIFATGRCANGEYVTRSLKK